VDDELHRLALDEMALELGGVVADVVDHREPQRLGRRAEDPPHHLAHLVRDHLPVGEGGVGGRRQRPEVRLPLGRAERRAGELPVPHRDPVGGHDLVEGPQVVGADLMPEAPRAAMEHHQHLARARDPERARHASVVDAVGRHHLHFQIMVAGAQRAELVQAPRHRPGADGLRIGARKAPAALGEGEILGPAVAALDAPPGPLEHHVAKRLGRQVDEPTGPDARRHGGEEGVDQLAEARPDLGLGEIGAQHAHAAVDVEADAARRDDPRVGAEGGHAADREAIAPVAVGHAERGPDDPGEARDVGHLLEDALVHPGQEGLRGVDPGGDQHPGLLARGDLPDAVGDGQRLHRSVRCR
jgi:hypothetical protein